MSYSFDVSPLLQPLFGNDEVLELFSAEADIAAMLEFETGLAKVQEKHGRIPKGTAKRIAAALDRVTFESEALMAAISRDGVAVPELVAKLKASVGRDDQAFVHLDTTSQDVIDTSFMMRAIVAMAAVHRDLSEASERIEALRKPFGSRRLMARTRMRQALPVTVDGRLDAWMGNLDTASEIVAALDYPLQLGGPVGAFADTQVREALAESLGLTAPERSWQNERGPMLAIGNACAGATGALGKIGADIALMAQDDLAEITLGGGGGSSSMPHKRNPVKAENLVTLARFNAALLSGLHNAAVHEQERSGAAWTLEWLVLPQMICAAAGAARLARELLESVESVGA